MGKKNKSFKVARQTARKIGKEGFTGEGGTKAVKKEKKATKVVVKEDKRKRKSS